MLFGHNLLTHVGHICYVKFWIIGQLSKGKLKSVANVVGIFRLTDTDMYQKRYDLRRRNTGSKRKIGAKRLVKNKLPELLLYTSYLHIHINIADETGSVGDNTVSSDNRVIPVTPTSTTSTEFCMDSSQVVPPGGRPVSVSSNGDARTGSADLGGDTSVITNHHHQLQNQSSLVSQNDTTINTSVSSSAPQTPNTGKNICARLKCE